MSRQTPTDLSIEPRDIHFDLGHITQRHWLGGDAVGTAVMNALCDALGVAHIDMPATPEVVWRALQAKAG